MAINLHARYADKLPKIWGHNSYIKGGVNEGYKWDGVNRIIVTDDISQPLNDYKRSGDNRFGETKDVQDWIQTMQLRNYKSYSSTIGKVDNSEQQMLKKTGRFVKKQTTEQVNPLRDQNAFREWSNHAGHVIEASAAITKDNIAPFIADANVYMKNAGVPVPSRRLYLRNSAEMTLKFSGEFAGCDIKEQLIIQGLLGRFSSFQVIGVPDDWIPENVEYIATHPESVFAPMKMEELYLYERVKGYSGPVVEGLYVFDAFVFGAKASGCVIGVNKTFKTATPAAAGGTSAGVTLTCATSGAVIRYTVDGSDPRYSDSAIIYTGAITKGEKDANLKIGDVIIAYAEKLSDGKFGSDVLKYKVTA